MHRRLVLVSLLAVAALALLAAACGGGDDKSASTPAGSEAAGTGPGAGNASSRNLCDLMPKDDIQRITSYEVGEQREHNGPESLHFCTIYVKVPGCNDMCALSLEDLGTIDPNSNNDSAAFRDTFTSVNPEAQATFQDNVVGADSWLATATAGDLAGLKLLYYKVGTNAYDLASPRIKGGALSEDQMIALAKLAAANAAR